MSRQTGSRQSQPLPRWPVQYSILTLLLLILACSVLAAWVGSQWYAARQEQAALRRAQEQAALRRVQELGYVSSWNYSSDHGALTAVTLFPNNSTPSGEDLDRLAGVRRLTLGGPLATDAWLSHLERAEDLRYLELRETAVGDAGLKQLSGMQALVELDLGNTAVTDAGLKHLAELSELRALQLNGTNITDDGLSALVPLRKLGGLNVTNTKVTAEGVERFRNMIQGRNINIDYGPYPAIAAPP